MGDSFLGPSANPVEKFFLRTTYPDLPGLGLTIHQAEPPLAPFSFPTFAPPLTDGSGKKFPLMKVSIMSEDQQWAKEVLLTGYSIVYEPAAAVLHSHNYGLKQVLQRNFDSGCSLRGVVRDSLSQMVAYELNYLRAGIKHLVREGKVTWMPYFILHEAVRCVGFFLGKISHRLPARINIHLSLHKYYWRFQVKKTENRGKGPELEQPQK